MSQEANAETTKSEQTAIPPVSLDALEKRPKREDVIYIYNTMLGRPPESEAVIADHLNSAQNIRELIKTFANSPEFISIIGHGLELSNFTESSFNPDIVESLKVKHDFNLFLHSLRTQELHKLPDGASTFLSAGCSGLWYFEWISENYPALERHIGIEAYSPRPENLPDNVEWIENTVGDMNQVDDGTVDLVFSGQNIEHLWPEDIVDFLCEAHRVLRQDAFLVIDSPNRKITRALGWVQPEHLLELTVAEVTSLVKSAGFSDISVRGVWRCYDSNTQKYFALEPVNELSLAKVAERVESAKNNPEDSFIWWLTARKSESEPCRDSLKDHISRIYEVVWPELLSRFYNLVGKVQDTNHNKIVVADKGERGHILYGPYIPLRPGHYVATFKVGSECKIGSPSEALMILDIVQGSEASVIISQEIFAHDLPPGNIVDIPLQFTLDQTYFGVQFRVFSTGEQSVKSIYKVDLDVK